MSEPLPADDTPARFNEMSVLAPLLAAYTVVYLGLMAVDFFARAQFQLLPGMMPVYVALLGAYAADKEIRRWMGHAEPPRKGSVFVYMWLLFFLVAFALYNFKPSFVLPDELSKVALQVLAIFFGSKTSKYVCESRRAAEDPTVLTQRMDKILALVRERGRITNRDVAEALQISDSSAKRLLGDLTVQGKLRQMGERKGTYYVAPEQAVTDK